MNTAVDWTGQVRGRWDGVAAGWAPGRFLLVLGLDNSGKITILKKKLSDEGITH
jgi:hypothetical protein